MEAHAVRLAQTLVVWVLTVVATAGTASSARAAATHITVGLTARSDASGARAETALVVRRIRKGLERHAHRACAATRSADHL